MNFQHFSICIEANRKSRKYVIYGYDSLPIFASNDNTLDIEIDQC